MPQDFLDSNGVHARLFETPSQVKTAKQAAGLMRVELHRILNSLVFMDAQTRPWLVLCPADRKVDLKKLENATCKTGLRLAESDEVEKTTGYAAGGVPPVSTYGIPTILDASVPAKKTVFAGGGDDRHLLQIDVFEIKKWVEDLRIADVSEPR